MVTNMCHEIVNKCYYEPTHQWSRLHSSHILHTSCSNQAV